MSRFIDNLTKMTKAAPQRIGFRMAREAAAGPRIHLIASVAGAAASLTDGVAGADAVLLRAAKAVPGAKVLRGLAGALPDMPLGVWLGGAGSESLKAFAGAGGDFVVFPVTSQVLAIPADDKVGRVLQVEAALSDGLLRAVEALPVDAVLTADIFEADAPVRWQHLLRCQRLAGVLSKPLLAEVPAGVTAEELKALWEAGVEGAVIEVSAALPAGRLGELRREIGKMTFLPSRRRGGVEALLPYSIGAKEAAADIDDDDDDEE